jgi:hypothetical protein
VLVAARTTSQVEALADQAVLQQERMQLQYQQHSQSLSVKAEMEIHQV